jgi:hypothetical protein
MFSRARWALLLCLLMEGLVNAQEPNTFLPPPLIEVPPPPEFYFSLDLSLVQPQLRGNHSDDGFFSPRLDWTVSPRFELGLTNRGPWNPYIGYRIVDSNRGEAGQDPTTGNDVFFGRSAQLNAIDLGIQSEVFPLLSVLQARWDLSARITVLDLKDVFDIESANGGFWTAHLKQEFVGAGPRGGIKLDLPFRDSGWSVGGQADAGLQWGGFRDCWQVVSGDGNNVQEDHGHTAKGGLLWHAGGQLALKYSWPACDPRIVYSMGYMYETWFSKDLGFLNGDDFGRFQYHGPFFRFEWRF